MVVTIVHQYVHQQGPAIKPHLLWGYIHQFPQSLKVNDIILDSKEDMGFQAQEAVSTGGEHILMF
jgi:hypothetical protein